MTSNNSLWILTQYGVDHDFLNPFTEQTLMWIADPTNLFSREFICCDTDVIEAAVAHTVLNHDLYKDETDSGVCKRVPVLLGDGVILYASVVSTAKSLPLLFPPHYRIADTERALERLSVRAFARLASLQFCSVHFTEVQHMLVAVNDRGQVVWKARTVEENYIAVMSLFPIPTEQSLVDGTEQIAPPGRRSLFSKYRLRRRAFLFDGETSLLGKQVQFQMTKGIHRALDGVLNADVVELIASDTVTRHRITPLEFRQGACAAAVTYATLRLLRVARLLGDYRGSLGEYASSPVPAKEAQACIKRAYKKCRLIFGRSLPRMVLRSGRVC